MPENDEVPLGDGVTATLISGMIRLRAARDEPGEDHVIYLEAETYDALRRFARKIGMETEPEKR